jgi:tRNA nucleotidyltransferase (CCA-adding enzyme)
MGLVARLDDIGKPAWITLMVLGFIIHWPIGLAILAYIIWSGRMSCWRHGGPSRWQSENAERFYEKASGWCGGRAGWHRRARSASSGNGAFDEYRAETLRRLEEEQKEFREFLDRLRQAKDKSEFDQFMADRSRRPQGPAPEAPPA